MESTMPKRQELDDDILYDNSKRRSPQKAMEEIRKQTTHDLYCPKCTRNITKTAQLLEKGDEFSPDNKKYFVHWIPLITPFKFLSNSPTGPVERTSSDPIHSSVVPVQNKSSNPNPSGPVENNSSNPNSSRPVDNISSNPNSNGPVENNSSNPSSSGSVNNHSSNPSPSRIVKMLRLPTIFRRIEENNVTNKEKDNNARHQSSTSASGKMKSIPGKYLGWLYHR